MSADTPTAAPEPTPSVSETFDRAAGNDLVTAGGEVGDAVAAMTFVDGEATAAEIRALRRSLTSTLDTLANARERSERDQEGTDA